jgi:alpha-1,3-glucan synthase
MADPLNQGQILSASSLQLTILEGAIGQSDQTLYTLCGIYAVSSICWWVMYRRLKSIYVLSAPFYCFGVCFFLLGMTYFANNDFARGWVFRVGTWMYTVGSSAGSLYFTLNFGTEGSF